MTENKSTPKINFENHINVKVMEILFPQGFAISSMDDLNFLKQKWRGNLAYWHSPYTCIFDFENISITENMAEEFLKLIKFFEKFFMRKIVGFKKPEQTITFNAHFEIFDSYADARAATGLARIDNRASTASQGLRDLIVIDNDFNAHVMEVSFSQLCEIKDKSDFEIFQSKIKNNLRLWHTPYSVLINCSQCVFNSEVFAEFEKFEKFLKSFFCKKILGYNPKEAKQNYPFETVRSRHVAAANLEHSGLQSGSKPHCSSLKK